MFIGIFHLNKFWSDRNWLKLSQAVVRINVFFCISDSGWKNVKANTDSHALKVMANLEHTKVLYKICMVFAGIRYGTHLGTPEDWETLGDSLLVMVIPTGSVSVSCKKYWSIFNLYIFMLQYRSVIFLNILKSFNWLSRDLILQNENTVCCMA